MLHAFFVSILLMVRMCAYRKCVIIATCFDLAKLYAFKTIQSVSVRGAARNFVRDGPVTDVVRFQTLVILHKDHFDVTGSIAT